MQHRYGTPSPPLRRHDCSRHYRQPERTADIPPFGNKASGGHRKQLIPEMQYTSNPRVSDQCRA